MLESGRLAHRPEKVQASGFTLIELLCALLITALLLTFTVPSYLDYRHRVQRVDALKSLQIAHLCMIRQATLTQAENPGKCTPAESRHYRFLFVSLNDEKEEWRAEPLGSQRGDPCGTLVLDTRGGKRVLGATLNVPRCWDGR